MILTEQDRSHPLWLALKSEYEARLVQLRAKNDNELSDTETAKLRGQIAEVKRFLDMDVVKPKIEIE